MHQEQCKLPVSEQPSPLTLSDGANISIKCDQFMRLHLLPLCSTQSPSCVPHAHGLDSSLTLPCPSTPSSVNSVSASITNPRKDRGLERASMKEMMWMWELPKVLIVAAREEQTYLVCQICLAFHQGCMHTPAPTRGLGWDFHALCNNFSVISWLFRSSDLIRQTFRIIPQAIAGLSICSSAVSLSVSASASYIVVVRCSNTATLRHRPTFQSLSARVISKAVHASPAPLVIQAPVGIAFDVTNAHSHACVGQRPPLYMDAAAPGACSEVQHFTTSLLWLVVLVLYSPLTSSKLHSYPLIPGASQLQQHQEIGAGLPLSGFCCVFMFINAKETRRKERKNKTPNTGDDCERDVSKSEGMGTGNRELTPDRVGMAEDPSLPLVQELCVRIHHKSKKGRSWERADTGGGGGVDAAVPAVIATARQEEAHLTIESNPAFHHSHVHVSTLNLLPAPVLLHFLNKLIQLMFWGSKEGKSKELEQVGVFASQLALNKFIGGALDTGEHCEWDRCE
ncbi:hypothetical protein OE88DRAFT_1646798 [Heliocybe sulcata]|uniref:Uncharacterized protein n=1 Tax=Heliocybe sulcata TaxID=5364 RepID=A0A5C3N4G7_9AGAM|nr:hypothetical protein OE88DRAFT_1646798 [Heliocybe sulcata]